jgi:2-polyprenyl-3-methyl-5-hydroxy-6-metoxy-1,4-benzoquinol methylase
VEKRKNNMASPDYNERLFSGGFRTFLHEARFNWLIAQMRKLNCPAKSILEIGCFDGKVLHFLDKKPLRYVGLDANWEGGLDSAKKDWANEKQFSFQEIHSPDEIDIDFETFEMAVIMETLEHVPPEMIEGYLSKINAHTTGYIFITVPNEIGIIFLMKWLAKKIAFKSAEDYSLRELLNAVIGKCHLVRRHEHKGFDYRTLIDQVRETFDIVSVSSIPGGLPPYLGFGVGIVARQKFYSKNRSQTGVLKRL